MKKPNVKVLLTGAVICAALFLFSAAMLAYEYLDRQQSAQTFHQLGTLVKDVSSVPNVTSSLQTAFETYAAVYERNQDFVGWVRIEGTGIDYPVMQTKDRPDFYLNHAFDKSYSRYGVPYLAETCEVGLSDNLVLYGHNMKDGTMFADLCRYTDEEFYKQHKTVRFDTLDGLAEYEVLAVFKTQVRSETGFPYYRFVTAHSEQEFADYVSQCKTLSLYDTGISAVYGDKLLTLSTCDNSRRDGRMVVLAKRITE